jgi:hypothetical protein
MVEGFLENFRCTTGTQAMMSVKAGRFAGSMNRV